MSLELKEDVDYNEIVWAAVQLCDYVKEKYDIQYVDQYQCPYFRKLAEQLYKEVDDEDR